MSDIDYGPVLEDLRARRDEIDAAIAVIEKFSTGPGAISAAARFSVAPAVVESLPVEGSPVPVRVESDTFFRMSASEATQKYLKMVKKPTSLVVICRALEGGGYLTSAKNFYSNLYTTLMRSSAFVQVNKDWGLAEWYPGKRTDPKVKRTNGGGGAATEEAPMAGGDPVTSPTEP
ncbi:MAG: hypothetical protein ABJC13_22515 [Acidobacteriota bacterium]